LVTSAEEGGASLGILSGFVAGNFRYYIGLAMVLLISRLLDQHSGTRHPNARTGRVFAFGLVAFGFLGMGPVTIAVDSYGARHPTTRNPCMSFAHRADSNIKQELKKDYNIDVNFERAKEMLEANDGAGNTFKATGKAGPYRYGGRGCDHHDFLDHHGAHQRLNRKRQ